MAGFAVFRNVFLKKHFIPKLFMLHLIVSTILQPAYTFPKFNKLYTFFDDFISWMEILNDFSMQDPWIVFISWKNIPACITATCKIFKQAQLGHDRTFCSQRKQENVIFPLTGCWMLNSLNESPFHLFLPQITFN